MDIEIVNPVTPPPGGRGYVACMTIRSFKGRRDVEVHLFRPSWPEEEMDIFDWDMLLEAPLPEEPGIDPEGSRKVWLETFTEAERDMLVAFLKERYADKLTNIRSRAMELPIPLGLTALSDVPEGKTIGFIRFERLPGCTLPFPLRGLYDLSQHKPIIEVEAEA